MAPPAGETGSFGFLSGTDETSRALTDTLNAYTATAHDAAAVKARLALEAKGRQALTAHAADAARILLAEQARFAQSPDAMMHLHYLLAETRAPAAMDALRATCMAPMPAALPSSTPSEEGQQPGDLVLRLQYSAVRQIGRVARLGDPAAKAVLLELVAAAPPHVVEQAVGDYYASSKQRFRAKRELALRIRDDQKYLLDSTY